jgi:DNA-binding response OmpR family regulator
VAASALGVLVVEDDDTLRHAVDAALRRAGYTVRAEPHGKDVDQVVKEFRPDLAILDVRLPIGPDGYAIARCLRDQHDDVPILFLTAADSRRARLDGFEAGGDDYVIKPFDIEELLARVAALLRRSGRQSVWRVADVVVNDGTRTVTRNGHDLVLTRTEYELMKVLIQHPRQVLSKEQLLLQVWGFDAWDTNLVEVHMSSLRRKLEAQGPRLIQTVRGTGYTLRP